MARGRAWSREEILATLARYRAQKRSLMRARVSNGLAGAAVRVFGSYRAAIEAAGIDYATVAGKVYRYSDEDLLGWLRKTARARPTITLVELTRDKRFGILRDRFGSWRAAVRQAGLRDWPRLKQKRWSKRSIIDALRAVAARGGSVSSEPTLHAAAIRYFGSGVAAAKAAGIRHGQHRKWERDDVIRAVRAIAKRHGRITWTLAQRASVAAAIQAHFGRLEAACEAAGVPGFHRTWRKEHRALDIRAELIRRLRAIAASLDRPVTRRDLPWTLSQALLRRFGGLAAARRAAKLPAPRRPKKWPIARIVDTLRAVYRRGTRITKRGLIEAGQSALAHAISSEIGSMIRARRLARLPEPEPLPLTFVPFVKIWDEDRVVDEIRAIAREGMPLASSQVPVRLTAAARVYWGSYQQAVEAAGFDYEQVVLHHRIEDDDLIARFRALAAKRPTMTLAELREHPIAHVVYRRFGGLTRTAERLGISGWPVRASHPAMSPADVRRTLRRRVAQRMSIERRVIRAELPRLEYSISRVHPVWSEALARLGFTAATRCG